ncbi:MAG: amino acid transporter [Psychromonas sp.]|jgi:amino acid transporter|uniref:APC family permease n=1 Tax=Psychromonas sp. TaxID=1884585 RepID=UPI0039E51CA0
MNNKLKQTLGFWSCFSVAVGLVVASSTMVALGQGMGIAGGGFVIAMIAAWILQHFSAQSYAELSCIMPHSGGIRTYTRVAMGALPAVVATILGFVVPNLFAIPTELAVASSVLSDTFFPSISPLIFGGILLISLTITNIVGVDIFAKLQIMFTMTMMVSMTLLGLIGLTGIGAAPAPVIADIPFNAMGTGVFSLTALAIWLFIGIEFVTPMAQETKNSERNIPRAMFLGLVVIFAVNLVYGFASLKYVPAEQLASSNQPHIDMARAILGRPGVIWISIISIFASASSISTVIAVVPRMLYGMALSHELPKIFCKIHPTFRTPWIGIIAMSSAIGAFYYGGICDAPNLVIYILSACCAWLFCYVIAHINVIILRVRYPKMHRPYKSRFYPIPQIIGTLGIIYSIVNIAPVPEMKEPIFTLVGIMTVLAVTYGVIWLKFVVKQPLFKPQSMREAQADWIQVEENLNITGITATFGIEPKDPVKSPV